VPLPMFSTPLIFETGQDGRANRYLPAGPALAELLPPDTLRDELPLPDNSELDVVRHFTRLSQKTFGIDTAFYPLGSCTMKYNPRINDAMANIPALRDLHPFTPDHAAQGALALMWELERALASLFGMAAFSLNPAAGAHAELTALLIAKAYFKARGESARNVVIVPDTAHGTNPASAAMVGFKVLSLKSDDKGRVDPDELRKVVGPDTAVCMMTNPNTLGLFEPRIHDVSDVVHAAGGLMYYDGANANALMGNTRPGDMGFDLMHLNLHKTFSVPHGGGGPGAGPVGASARLAPYLPVPRVLKRDSDGKGAEFALDVAAPNSIGPVRVFASHFIALVRAYAYIVVHGLDGLRRNSQLAVLNANYLRERVKDLLTVPYADRCRHEFVCSAEDLKKMTGVRALDIAKGLLDAGIHAPTMYWPHVVPECLMIEPTETETKQTLDGFVEVLRGLVTQAHADPDSMRELPRNTAVRRVDEAQVGRLANKGIGLRWTPGG